NCPPDAYPLLLRAEGGQCAPSAPCGSQPTGRIRDSRDVKNGDGRWHRLRPVHAVAEQGRAEEGIFWGQELAGQAAIITRRRLPVCGDEKPSLCPAGEAQATDPPREVHLAVARCDRRVQAAQDNQWIETSQVQRTLTLTWRSAVSRSTLTWSGTLGRVVPVEKPDGVRVSMLQPFRVQPGAHTLRVDAKGDNPLRVLTKTVRLKWMRAVRPHYPPAPPGHAESPTASERPRGWGKCRYLAFTSINDGPLWRRGACAVPAGCRPRLRQPP